VKLKAMGSLRMKLEMLEMAKLEICNNHPTRTCTTTQVTSTFRRPTMSIVELHFLKW
jgi:hypothetical protein